MDFWGRLPFWRLLLGCIFLLHHAVHGTIPQPRDPGGIPNVLVLDIDGTVYDDDCHIESQIRDNCHIFSSTFGYTAAESEELHVKYGSTIRGICENGEPRIKFLEYYNDVYPNLDMSLLRKYSASSSKGSTGYNVEMGSALRSLHNMDCPIVVASNSPVFHVKRVLTRLGLSKLKVQAFLTPERRGGITKNEAKFWDPLFELYPKDQFLCTLLDDNALNVALVRELGMRALRITPSLPLPEALVHFMNLLPAHCSEPSSLSTPSNKNVLQVPEKVTEKFEFNEVSYLEAKNEIDKMSFNQEILTMLRKQLKDRIQQRFAKKGDCKKFPLVAVDLGAGLLNMLPTIQNIFSDAASLNEMYEVELQYVAFESNKNIEKHTIAKLKEQLGFKSIPSSIDLTANTVSTIRADIKSFKKTVKTPGVNGVKGRIMVVTVHLVAEDFMSENALKILNDVLGSHRCAGGQQVTAKDTKYTLSRPPVDLFVGCCVADLISPSALAGQVLEMAGDGGGLLYLPITFCGKTNITSERKDPSGPPLEIRRDILPGSDPPKVPEDSVVYSLYHNHLEKMGHYLEPDRLLSELGAYGYSVLLPSSNNATTASSNWKISETKNPYMWKCMVRFIALGTVFQGLGKYNMKGWFEDLNEMAKQCYLTIDVSNIDILAVLPEIVQRILSPEEVIKNAVKPSLDSAMCTDFGSPLADAFKSTPAISRLRRSTAVHRDTSEHIHEHIHTRGSESEMASKSVLHVPTSRSSVEFLSPGVVHVVQEPVPSIGIDQLLVRTTCSLVSTGTELKIFSGDLDSDSPADLTISGMEDKMTYPLRYGYSSVGRVVAVGSAMNQAEWMGKLVFSFSPHSSAVVVDASSVMEVPQGIEPEDAVFLPSVETAVSLVQAARPNIGERVLVVGQGLIGLLTGAVMTHHLPYTETTVSDISEKRLSVASKFNERALIWNPLEFNPWSNSETGGSDYDLSIEVSGNPKGLQTAIDNTGVNGRIVVGSWYGEKPAPLKLGLKFHRSGLRLITSQVSNIHPELTGRWSKKRRFDLTWETLKQIKPSKLISSVAVLKSDEVLAAYTRLQKGEDVTVLFKSE